MGRKMSDLLNPRKRNQNMKKDYTTTYIILYYLPRVIGVSAILFISSFALDVFVAGEPLSRILVGLSIHLIPSFVLVFILAIAWKFARLGGALFILVSLVPFFLLSNVWWVNLLLAAPFFATGILFLVEAQWLSSQLDN